jgi:hypothetical protein
MLQISNHDLYADPPLCGTDAKGHLRCPIMDAFWRIAKMPRQRGERIAVLYTQRI